MNNDSQPQWHSSIDRWVLIIGGVLAIGAGIWAASSLRRPPPTPTPVPTVIAEATPAAQATTAQPTGESITTPASAEATPVAGEAAPAPAQPESAEVANLSEGATLSADAPGPISGVAPPGSTVTVSENGVVLAQTTADESGNWQIDLPALPPGQHELTVAAADAEGQPLGEPQTLVVSAVPAANIIAPVVNAPVSAPSEGEAATISGVAPPGSTVTVYEGDTILGETTADENGNWSLELPDLAAGEHTIEAAATDANGQPLGQPTSIALDVVAAPVAAATTPAAGEATPTTGESSPKPGEATPAPAQPESAEVANLSEGATLSADAPGPISGVAPPGSTVTVSENGVVLAQTTADESGNWQIDLPALPPGQHELTVAAADAEGQPLGEPQTLVVSAVPAANIIAPVVNAPVSAPSEGEAATISGVAPPGSTVTVYEGDTILGETTADENGNWSLELPGLAAGEHTIEAAATDANGQPLGQPTSIALDVVAAPVAAATTPAAGEATPVAGATTAPAGEATPAPTLAMTALLSNLASPLNNSIPTFRGTAAPGSEVVLFEGDKRLGETKAGERGNWLITPDKPLTSGEHQLRIEITPPGAETPIIIDANIIVSEDARPLTPPRIEKPRRGRLGVGNQLSGRAPAEAIVEIMDGDEVIGSAKAGPQGRWSFRLPVATPAGEHSFRIVVRGPNGEVLAESAPLTLRIINTGPPKLLPPTGGRHPG